MEKTLKNYILSGKGFGLLVILAVSLVITIAMMIPFKEIVSSASPRIIAVAEDILPIEVKEGKIVSPVDVYKKVEINLGDESNLKDTFPVVLDTRESSVEAIPTGSFGLYLHKDIVYFVSENEIKRFNLPDGVIDNEKFRQMMDTGVMYFSVLASIMTLSAIFLVFLLKTLVVAVCSFMGLKWAGISQEQMAFDKVMRASSIVFIGVEIILFAIRLLVPFGFGGLMSIVLSVGGVWVVFKSFLKED